MALSTNPTKTRGIEKAWNREINKRWRRFNKNIFAALKNIDDFDQIVINVFEISPPQLRAFMIFLQRQIDTILMGDWQEKYQLRSYERAMNRAMEDLRRQGERLDASQEEVAIADAIASFTATATLGSSYINRPIHQTALEFLFTRSFESLENVTNEMATQIRTILFQGVEQGLGFKEVSKQIKERTGVSKSRAELIASTETTQAHQRGTINQAVVASEITGEDVNLIWETRRDNRVRPLHVSFHGDIMTPEEASRKITISPWRCRCGLRLIIEEMDTPALRSVKKKEQQFLRELTK